MLQEIVIALFFEYFRAYITFTNTILELLFLQKTILNLIY